MSAQEFDQQMRRLIDTYGPQHYRQERLTLLWREVKDFDYRWLERVVDEMLGSSRQAPLPADFSEHVSRERERRWRLQKEQAQVEWNGTPGCRFCKDTGIRMCIKHGAPGVWAFRCDCERGRKDPRVKIPQWESGYEGLGYEWTDLPVFVGGRAAG